jgi:hypothetical protein
MRTTCSPSSQHSRKQSISPERMAMLRWSRVCGAWTTKKEPDHCGRRERDVLAEPGSKAVRFVVASFNRDELKCSRSQKPAFCGVSMTVARGRPTTLSELPETVLLTLNRGRVPSNCAVQETQICLRWNFLLPHALARSVWGVSHSIQVVRPFWPRTSYGSEG